MEIQFHPATGRARVRTLAFGRTGERVAAAVAGAAAFAALSVWITAPVAVGRWLRETDAARLASEAQVVRADRGRVVALAAALRERAIDRGDLLNRIAFLYGISPAGWPRVLAPERGLLVSAAPGSVASSLPAYERGLEKGRALLEEREAADQELPARTPSILPIAGGIAEPAAYFGPRVSPWTGAQEFFTGLELAAPEGAGVVAPASGVVVFAGRVRASPVSKLWQLGNLVLLSHGKGGVTVYGHLGRIEVRRGQRLTRRQKLGNAGRTGWALAPGLHYEYWRAGPDGLRPTDPLFAVLDERRRVGSASLERMAATSAPGPAEVLP